MRKNNYKISNKMNQGFTLVELLVTITILGIITAMAFPLIRKISMEGENKKYTVYRDSLTSGAKLYVDSYSEDLFGHLKSGCAYISYRELSGKSLVKEISIEDITCDTEETYIKVIKINNRYSYSTFMGCGNKTEGSKVNIVKRLPENIPKMEDENCGLGKPTISIKGNPTTTKVPEKKELNVKLTLQSNTGLLRSPNISYGWSKTKNSTDITNWSKLNFKAPSKKEQEKIIFDENRKLEVSQSVTTPSGATGDYYLILNIEELYDLAGMVYEGEKYLYFGPYRLDNIPPDMKNSTVVSNITGYNSLEPKLNLNASDNYTPASQLKMCISYDKDTCKKTSAAIEKYDKYVKNKKLSKISTKYDGSTHKVFVTVADRAGNYTTRNYSYRVAKKNRLTYNSNGGNVCSPSYKEELENKKIGTLCTPTRKGYNFSNWTTNKNGSGDIITKDTILKKDTTVFAQWKIINYKITYTLGSGVTNNNPTTYTINTKDFTLKEPKRTGYTFNGWTGTDISKVTKTVTIKKGSTGDRKYTANWTIKKYKLTYNSDGGTACASIEKNYNSQWGSLCKPKKDGYTFGGWYTQRNGKGTNITSSSRATDNLTVYAKWTPINYKISYTLNGGTVSGNPSTYTITTKDFTLKEPKRTGYTFNGWTGTDISKVTKTVTIKKGSTGDRKYTANWTIKKYKLTYNSDGGTACASIEKNYNSQWGSLCSSKKDGYTFGGWYTQRNGKGTKITSSSRATDNLTVYAKWTPISYKISYNLNGGTVSGNPSTYTTSTERFVLNNPTKTGYTFEGWTGTGLSTKTKSVAIAKGSKGDRIYTANWKIGQYTITYNGNGSTGGSTSPTTCTYNQDCALRGNGFSKTGHTFDGWYTASTGGSKYGATTRITNNITVYARWKASTYTLTYDSTGGSACGAKTGTYGSAWGALCTPTKSARRFEGWYTAKNGGGTRITATSIISGNLKVYAKWKKVEKPSCELKIKDGTKGKNGWYKSNVEIKLKVTGDAVTKGIAKSKNSTNGATTTTITDEGTSKYYGYVANEAGGASCSISVSIDKTAPTITDKKKHCGRWAGGLPSDTWYYTLKLHDGTSGINYRTINHNETKDQTDYYNGEKTIVDHIGHNNASTTYNVKTICDMAGNCSKATGKQTVKKPNKC